MTSRFIKGFGDASRGLGILLQKEIHFRVQAIIATLLLAIIVFLPLTYSEAGFMVLAITLVLASEAANTVVERMMDVITTNYSPRIGRIKDMMAAFVLINSMGSFAIGVITVVHYAMRIKENTPRGNWDTAILFRLNDFASQSGFSSALIIFAASTLAVVLVLIFFLSLLLTRISMREKINRFIAAAASAFLARYVVVEVIRYFVLRPRPFIVYPLHQLVVENSRSFPSGHAAFFFALSAAIFSWDKRLGMLFFLASIAMGVGRVAAGVHYPSDIVGGAILGIATAWVVKYIISVIKR